MKKAGVLLCTVAMGAALAFGLTACGGGGDQSADNGATEAKASYVIATDTTFAPFEYQNADGNYEGIDVEILEAVAADQGFAYDLQPLGFDAALQAVQAGQADGVIAGMSITDERKEVFDFSEPYYDSTVCCAVADDSSIASLEDLKDQKVAVKTGTQSAKWAESIADQYGFTTTAFDTSDIMYQDVAAGNSVACFEDTPVLSYAISTGQVKLKIINTVDADSEYATPYGFAVQKDANADLLAAFNAGLQNIKDSGKYQEIVDKYVQS